MALPALAAVGGLSGLGSALGGFGTLLGGAGALAGAFGAGGGQANPADLYAQLAPGQAELTLQQMMLGARIQPLMQAYSGQNQVLAQSAYDQFKNALSKDQTGAGMLAGVASQYANSAIGLQDLAGKSKIAAETLGLETAGNLAKTYATAAGNLQSQILTGEAGMLTPTATATAQAGLSAQQGKNLLASNIGATNLDIRKSQEQTRNAMALERARVEGDLAKRRYGASQVGGALAYFA